MHWILAKENNETLLMKYSPAIGGMSERWLIRKGDYITLGELFVFGARRCSCWDLYRAYTVFDIFIHKKPHSVSSSEPAIFRANAKRARRENTGRWGLS